MITNSISRYQIIFDQLYLNIASMIYRRLWWWNNIISGTREVDNAINADVTTNFPPVPWDCSCSVCVTVLIQMILFWMTKYWCVKTQNSDAACKFLEIFNLHADAKLDSLINGVYMVECYECRLDWVVQIWKLNFKPMRTTVLMSVIYSDLTFRLGPCEILLRSFFCFE